MSAQMVEVSLLGVGTVRLLERGAYQKYRAALALKLV